MIREGLADAILYKIYKKIEKWKILPYNVNIFQKQEG
jgi:hypothetical protein